MIDELYGINKILKNARLTEVFYPTLIQEEDFIENETTSIYYYSRDEIHIYRCVRCGCDKILSEDEKCPKCERVIL